MLIVTSSPMACWGSLLEVGLYGDHSTVFEYSWLPRSFGNSVTTFFLFQLDSSCVIYGSNSLKFPEPGWHSFYFLIVLRAVYEIIFYPIGHFFFIIAVWGKLRIWLLDVIFLVSPNYPILTYFMKYIWHGCTHTSADFSFNLQEFRWGVFPLFLTQLEAATLDCTHDTSAAKPALRSSSLLTALSTCIPDAK